MKRTNNFSVKNGNWGKMKAFIILIMMSFSQISLAHYECNGICKYNYDGPGGGLRSSTVSSASSSRGTAESSMRSSCSRYCDGDRTTGCRIVNYSCSTPGHNGIASEILDIYVEEVDRENEIEGENIQ